VGKLEAKGPAGDLEPIRLIEDVARLEFFADRLAGFPVVETGEFLAHPNLDLPTRTISQGSYRNTSFFELDLGRRVAFLGR
jgi:hypothetical protein